MAYAQTPGVAQSLFNSLWLSAISSTLCVALAYGYAYGVVRSCMPLAAWFRAIALVPLLAPSLLMAISLIYLFGAQGLLKSWLLGGTAYGPFRHHPGLGAVDVSACADDSVHHAGLGRCAPV
jgi:iron(III) transport system permease protein